MALHDSHPQKILWMKRSVVKKPTTPLEAPTFLENAGPKNNGPGKKTARNDVSQGETTEKSKAETKNDANPRTEKPNTVQKKGSISKRKL